MTSPTKAKLCKENADMITLKEIDSGLYQKLYTIYEDLLNAKIQQIVNDPNKLSILFDSKNLIEEIERFQLNPKAQKIKTFLYQWQTELIFHYNHLLNKIKSQPSSIIIKFLQHNFAVDLMQPVPLTPRKSARLQAQAKESSPKKDSEESINGYVELTHKKTVARNLMFDFNNSAKSDPINEQILDVSKRSPRL